MPRTPKTAAAADKAGEGQPGTPPGHIINGVAASPADLRFILTLVGNLASKPDINWEELAATLGLKDKKGKSGGPPWMRSPMNSFFLCLLVSPPQS